MLVLTTMASFAFQWHVLVHLPIVDCLPYRVHNDILEKMKPPPGAIPDSTTITMVYEKGGKQIEFNASNFPADFSDSYHFVKRYDKLIRKGNADIPIKDFNLLTGAGTDSTQAVLEAKGYKLFVFVRIWIMCRERRKDLAWRLPWPDRKNIPVFLITADYDELSGWTRAKGSTAWSRS